MTRNEFINELIKRLNSLPVSEIEKSTSYYIEIINDRIEEGMTEEEAVAAFGDIDDIVNEILIETPLPVLFKAKAKEKAAKNQKTESDSNSKKGILIVLLILGSPIWVSLLAGLVSALFGIAVAIIAVVFSIFVTIFACGVSGIFVFFSGIVFIFTRSVAEGFMTIGISLFAMSLALVLVKPGIWLFKKIISLLSHPIKKIKSLFIRKGV